MDAGEFHSLSREVTALQVKVDSLQRQISELVSKAEFFPVKLIAYGLAAGSMGAVITAIVSSVIIRP